MLHKKIKYKYNTSFVIIESCHRYTHDHIIQTKLIIDVCHIDITVSYHIRSSYQESINYSKNNVYKNLFDTEKCKIMKHIVNINDTFVWSFVNKNTV